MKNTKMRYGPWVLSAATALATVATLSVGAAPAAWATTNPTVSVFAGTPFGTADFDGDGHPDVIARSDATGDLWLYPGPGVPATP